MSDIARIDPRELVVPDSLFDDDELRQLFETVDAAVQAQPAALFDSSRAAQNLQQFYGVSTLDGFGNFSRAQLAAANAAIAYIEKTQIGERPSLSRPEREETSQVMYIDAATRANLELVQTLGGSRDGSLLKTVDRTVSGGGARLLAQRLMNPLTDPDGTNSRLDEVAYFLAHDGLRDQLRSLLKGVPDMPRALSRLSLNRGGPRDLVTLKVGLQATRALVKLLHPASGELPDNLADGLSALMQLPEELENYLSALLADEVPLLARDGNFVRKGFDEDLDQLRDLSNESRKVIAGLQAHYADETGVKNLKIRHNNVLGFFIEVTALNATSLSDNKELFIHRQTMANAMRFTTAELAELESKIANAAGKALQLERGHFSEAQIKVLDQATIVQQLAASIASLDVATALAELAVEQGYVRPTIDDSLTFAVTAGRHPVVEQALRRQAASPFVANDCDIGGDDAGRLWLLTGPNMGG